MLFISILLAVWFCVWLYFAYQQHVMSQIRTSIMIDFHDDKFKEEDQHAG